MFDINRHKFLLVQILKDIYTDVELAQYVGFKGGTALMFFYDLPRFSVDLDFNLIYSEQETYVYKKIRMILKQYGKIFDEAQKFYGPLLVLSYGFGERKLKVEISNRKFSDKYEIKNLLGINVRVMVQEDMFAHKLCALLDRNTMTPRDIFDCWFFMNRRTSINKDIVETRMKMPLSEYLQRCIEHVESINNRVLSQGLGEMIDDNLRRFVKTKMKDEVIGYMRLYLNFPIL